MGSIGSAIMKNSLVCLSAACLLLAATSVAAQSAPAPFRDEFDGSALDAAWTFTDHFAIAEPDAIDDHVVLTMTGDQVSMSFPAGAEHNQWWIEHAQITREYPGSGVYETRMDTGMTGNQQFGLIFEGDDPGTFMMFMMYGAGFVRGYIERFAVVDGVQYRETFSVNNDPRRFLPDAGPYHLRVTVTDEGEAWERNWKFEWSPDGVTWKTYIEGPLEGVGVGENAGTIRNVGLFVGNHPPGRDGFDGRYAYFDYAPPSEEEEPPPDEEDPPPPPPDEELPPPYDPPSNLPLDQLVLWLDATSAATELANGDPVTTWQDDSGGALDAMTTETLAPVVERGAIGTRPALRFDGADDHFTLPTAFDDFTDGLTVFMVAQPTTLQPGFKMLALGNGPGADMVVLGRNGSSSGLQYFTSNASGGVRWFNTGDALSAGEAGVFRVRQAGGAVGGTVTAVVSKNGESVGEGTVNVPPVVARAENLIGKSFWNEGRFEGHIAEVMLYARELSDEDVAIVERYLDQKYELGFTEPPPPPDPDPAGDTIPAEGLVLLLDAEDAAADYGLDAEVSIWDDLSETSGAATASPGEGPLVVGDAINGRPALLFDGLDDHFALPAGFEDFGDGMSVYVVARPTVLQTGFKMLALGNGPGQDMVVLGRNGSSSGLQYFTSNASGGVRWFNTAPGLEAGQVDLFSVHQEAGVPGDLVTAEVSRDLEVVGSGSVYVPPVATRAGSLLGKSFWNEGMFQGEIAEVIVYDRALSDEERAVVETYLDGKYGLGLGLADSEPPPPPEEEEPPPPPADVPAGLPVDGLELFLNAGTAAGYFDEGAPVTLWQDQSDAAMDAVTDEDTAPLLVTDGIGGEPVLRFDGIDDHLELPAGFDGLDGGVSLFVVMRPTALQPGFKILALGNGPGQDMVVLGRAGSTDGLQYFATNESGGVKWFNTSPVLVEGQPGLFAVEHEGFTARVVVDGEVITERPVDPAKVATRSVNLIGKSFWNEGMFEGDLAEIILYDRPLSDVERIAVEDYLSAKYSLELATAP